MNNSTISSPRILWLLTALYLCQGLPSGILAHAMPALMRSWGASLEVIGLLKLLAIPWALKLLWAPVLDGGRRRQPWIMFTQCATVMLLLVSAMLSPAGAAPHVLWLLCGALFLLNVCSAVQDTATDGLAVKLLPVSALGLGNSVQVAAYKLGLIVGGSGLLFAIGYIGWTNAVLLLAGIVAICTLPVGRVREPSGGLAITERPSLVAAYRGFASQPGVWGGIALVVVYKIGDSFGSAMIRPMLIDQGHSLAEVARLTLLAAVASLPAAWLGGVIYSRFGALNALLYLGVAQMFGLLGWSLVASAPENASLLYGVLIFEQMADAMSTVALFAFMMSLCRAGCESGDYTVQACLQASVAGAAGASSGAFASWLGYQYHFWVAALLAVVALTGVTWAVRRCATVEQRGAE